MISSVGTARAATFRELSAEEVGEVSALRDRILSRPRHPDDYVRHDEEDAFLAAHLGRAGICIGIEVESRLLGFTALTLDVERAHLDVELRDAIRSRGSADDETCILAVTMLDPTVRGRGLHRRAIELRLEIARGLGRTRAVSMVSPSNTSSLCNLLRRGGRIEAILDLAGGRARYLVGFGPAVASADEGESPFLVPLTDLAGVRPLLGDGFVGDAIVFEAGHPHLRLSRAAPR